MTQQKSFWKKEAASVFKSLGDVRERAVTMGKIADILQARGQLDEALKIRNEEELPVYERLGDVRSRAVTMGQDRRYPASRGDLDEALHIRREEQLPVYERLGDVRSRAVTMGKIADILQAAAISTRPCASGARRSFRSMNASATCARAP